MVYCLLISGKTIFHLGTVNIAMESVLVVCVCVCVGEGGGQHINAIWFKFDLILTSPQQSFIYIGTGLPGLNQYLARINVSCSRTATQ